MLRGLEVGAGAALLWMVSGTAAAQEWRINIQEDAAQQLGLDPVALENELKTSFNDELKVLDQTAFLEDMAAASVMAVKGMGADYGTNPQRLVLGYSVGSAATGAGFTFGRGDQALPTSGFAFQMAALAGVNLGVLADEESQLRRITLYANGMVADTRPEPFEASTYHVAAHGQLKLIRPGGENQGGPVEWGGLDLTSGIEITSSRLTLVSGFPLEHNGIRWDAVGSYEVETNATSIPVELSTNLRVLVLTVFAGAAVDLTQSATADSTISLGGAMRSTGPVEVDIGSAQLTLTDRGSAGAYTPRAFAGAQLNLVMFKVYGHLNAAVDGTVGGHVGLRMAL